MTRGNTMRRHALYDASCFLVLFVNGLRRFCHRSGKGLNNCDMTAVREAGNGDCEINEAVFLSCHPSHS